MPTQSLLADEFKVSRSVIRQAMTILGREGRLTEATRGAPPRVAAPAEVEPAAGDGKPVETLVALGPRIVEAFLADEVRIDAICLTAESLSATLGEPRRVLLERRAEGRFVPSSIQVRVLLPDRHINLAFPRSVDDSDDGPLVHGRWLKQRNAHAAVLHDHLTGLGDALGIPVDVAFRALPFTPPVKLYLLNGVEALFAYYQVAERAARIDDTQVQMYDTRGDQSPLFSFGAGSGTSERDRAFVSLSQSWFDSIWGTIVSDLAFD